jgi:hypothetical protein
VKNKRESVKMVSCQDCGREIGYTKFTAIVNSHKEEMCKTCFFKHINLGFEKLAGKRGGHLSYEVISSLFITE